MHKEQDIQLTLCDVDAIKIHQLKKLFRHIIQIEILMAILAIVTVYLLVHVPDVFVLNGENDKTFWIFTE